MSLSARCGRATLDPMVRVQVQAVLVAVSVWGAASPARADWIPEEPCSVEAAALHLGERCLVCEASEYEPERCRQAFEAAGLRPRCEARALGETIDGTIWGELWCLPRGASEPLPAALPPVARVVEPGDDSLAPWPKMPPGFVLDRSSLGPQAQRKLAHIEAARAGAEAKAPEVPSVPQPPPQPQPPQACSGCRASGSLPWFAVVVLLARRRRGGRGPRGATA